MLKCETGSIYKKEYAGGLYYMLRLNIIDTDESNKKLRYKSKSISTGLRATRKNKLAAEALLADEIEKYNLNNDDSHLSLAAFCDKWMKDKQSTLETTTYEGYEYRVRRIKEYFGNERLLVAIKPADVQDFYQYLLSVNVYKGKKVVKGYSNRSLKDTATLFTAILEDAVNLELLQKNPAAAIKIPQRPVSRKQRLYLAPEDIELFRKAIGGHRLKNMFLLALYCGMRREELLGLTWSAIRNGKIYVERTVARVKTIVEKDRAKTEAGFRSYQITPEIGAILDEIKETQAYYRELAGDSYKDSDYIFTWEDGHPYAPDYVSKAFRKILKQSGLDSRLTLHDLRASCVSILFHAGMDIKDVQAWIGHADVSTTLNIYASTNERRQKAVAETMAKTIFTENLSSDSMPAP